MIRVSVISIIVLNFLLNASRSFSQTDSSWTVNLDSIVISDNRIENKFSEASRDINIITRKEISLNPVHSLPEILMYSPGVDIRQRGPMGVQADVGIRGGSFEQTLVMINGIKMNDPQTGHHNLNLPIDWSNVDRVEIIKGPGARLYGQDAFSGAINFITSIPEDRRIDAEISGGDFNLYGGSLSLSLPAGKLKQMVTVSGSRSDGYRENTDFRIGNIFYENRFPAGKGNFHVMGGYVLRKFGANGFYADPSYTRQYEEIKTGLAAVEYENQTSAFTWHPRVYLRVNRDDYFFVREDPSIYENLHITDVGGAEINTSWKNSLGTTGMGIETRYEAIHGTWTRSGEQTPSNLDGFDRKNLGFYLEHKIKAGAFDATPGIYAGYYSDFGWNAFPGLDLGYSLNRNFRIYANAGRAFRVPDFYDLYYDSPVEKGNPDLVPEETVSYEGGIRYLGRFISGDANVFRQSSNNLIDWIQVPVTDSTYYWNAQNITHINRTGLEFGMDFDFTRIAGTDPWIQRVNFSYDYLFSDLKNNGYQSRYILENLKHQLLIGINHKLIWRIYDQFMIRYNRREGAEGYWLLDSRVYWQHNNKPMVYVEVTNITDTQYTEVMTPMPGRWFKIGLKYDLGF
jgi:vitamin B12 transporter